MSAQSSARLMAKVRDRLNLDVYTDWEKKFLRDLVAKYATRPTLSPAQERTLRTIIDRRWVKGISPDDWTRVDPQLSWEYVLLREAAAIILADDPRFPSTATLRTWLLRHPKHEVLAVVHYPTAQPKDMPPVADTVRKRQRIADIVDRLAQQPPPVPARPVDAVELDEALRILGI